MVNILETDKMFWEDTLAWAERTGNSDLVETLRQIGPPPYDDLLDYTIITSHEHDWNSYPGVENSREMPFNTFVPENSLMDRVNAMRGLLDTYFALYPQLQEIDFRDDVTRLEVPVYIILGEYEARGRTILVEAWFELLEAPCKELIVFEHSGHRPNFEQPAEFAEIMEQVVSNCTDGTP
jgi:pimeloyl-ACP methyl ester carboxylesterase